MDKLLQYGRGGRDTHPHLEGGNLEFTTVLIFLSAQLEDYCTRRLVPRTLPSARSVLFTSCVRRTKSHQPVVVHILCMQESIFQGSIPSRTSSRTRKDLPIH